MDAHHRLAAVGRGIVDGHEHEPAGSVGIHDDGASSHQLSSLEGAG